MSALDLTNDEVFEKLRAEILAFEGQPDFEAKRAELLAKRNVTLDEMIAAIIARLRNLEER